MQVEENAKLPPSQRVPMLKSSDDLVPLHWEASALGALQEAGEAYLIGIQHLMKHVQLMYKSNFRETHVQKMFIQVILKVQTCVRCMLSGLLFSRRILNLLGESKKMPCK